MLSELWSSQLLEQLATSSQILSDTHREIEATSISGLRILCNMLVDAEPATTTPHAVPVSRHGSKQLLDRGTPMTGT